MNPHRITLRARGQLTLPPAVVKAAELQPGQTIQVDYQEDEDILILRPLTVLVRQMREGKA